MCGFAGFLSATGSSRDEGLSVLRRMDAFWPVSIAWTGYSIVRDSLVWFLMILSILLILRVIDGARPAARLAAVALIATLVVLRFVRAYAEFIVVFGVGIAALWWLLHFDKRFVRAALMLCAVVISVEGIVAAVGGANAPYLARLYGATVMRYMMKSLPSPSPPPNMAVVPSPVPRAKISSTPRAAQPMIVAGARPAVQPENQTTTIVPAKPVSPSEVHRTGPGLLTNGIRFLFGPFAWTADIANAGNWQLPAMWFWYAILPAAVGGLFLGLRERPALRVVSFASLLFAVALGITGRGDSFRHREMIMPICILGLGLSIGFARRHWRPFLILYVVYLIGLSGLIMYHRHTLKQRGMIATISSDLYQSRKRRKVFTVTAFAHPGARNGWHAQDRPPHH